MTTKNELTTCCMQETVNNYFKDRPQLLRTREIECFIEAGIKAGFELGQKGQWISVDNPPSHSRPVLIACTPLVKNYQFNVGQFYQGAWYYTGSDTRIRDAELWQEINSPESPGE